MRAALLLLALAACGSDEDDRPATWEYIHAAILVPNCATSGCHSSLTHQGFGDNPNIDMSDSVKACKVLFGLHSTLIDPNNLDGNAILTTSGLESGVVPGGIRFRMPPDQPLPRADLRLIARWVAAGSPCPAGAQ